LCRWAEQGIAIGIDHDFQRHAKATAIFKDMLMAAGYSRWSGIKVHAFCERHLLRRFARYFDAIAISQSPIAAANA
jgi:hypothetical protein